MKTATRFRLGGFTLVELVITIVIIGILSAATVAYYINATAQHGMTTQADKFRRDLSHIQLLAISQGQRLMINASGSGYTVTSCTPSSACGTTNCGSPLYSVDLNDPSVGLNNVSIAASPTNPLCFDSLGRPQDAGGLITANPATTYTLSGGGRSTDVTITVLPVTGFAQLVSY